MTTYRLPEALGGGEVRIDTSPAAASPHKGFVRVLVESDDETFPIEVPRSALVEVKPPLPPEPAFGSVLHCDDGYLHTRKGRSWNDHDDGYCTWEQLNAAHDRPLVLLVPDPFAEPVELPWKRHGVEVQQTTSDNGPGHHVHVSTKEASYGFAHLSPSQARDMARAMWAAADAAEASS